MLHRQLARLKVFSSLPFSSLMQSKWSVLVARFSSYLVSNAVCMFFQHYTTTFECTRQISAPTGYKYN